MCAASPSDSALLIMRAREIWPYSVPHNGDLLEQAGLREKGRAAFLHVLDGEARGVYMCFVGSVMSDISFQFNSSHLISFCFNPIHFIVIFVSVFCARSLWNSVYRQNEPQNTGSTILFKTCNAA